MYMKPTLENVTQNQDLESAAKVPKIYHHTVVFSLFKLVDLACPSRAHDVTSLGLFQAFGTTLEP